jgi:hypothetical protein
MSYSNPDILILSAPIGLDAVIQSLQQDLYAGLPWLQKSFGRAREFMDEGTKVPKAYMGDGEYHSVLPNDFLTAQSFVLARSEERWPSYPIHGLERDLSIIFWCNLKTIHPDKNYIFTEELRWDVEKIIKANPRVQKITGFYDDRIEDVFIGFIGQNNGIDGAKIKGEMLMYPYAGFRYDITVAYPEHADCLVWTSGFNSSMIFMDDIDFVVSGGRIGATTYQDNKLKGKKIRLIREGLLQHTQNINNNWFWSFSSGSGTITVDPAWIKDERVKIEIYGYA